MDAKLEASSPPVSRSTSLPEDLSTPTTKLCYLALDQTDTATLEELDEALELGKLTLLDVLGTMTERGHVERTAGGRYAVVR